MKTYVPNPGPRATSFENPGYDSTTGFGTGDDGLYSDLPQPMFFSPYEDLTNYNSNHGDFGSKVSLRSTASIKKLKANQVDITVQGDEKESDKKESAMMPDNVVCKEQENKGQTVLCLETGEELEKASEM